MPTGKVLPGRRNSRYVMPVPVARQERNAQIEFPTEAEETEYINVTPIREEVDKWRKLPPEKWNVTYETQRLLTYWRSKEAIPRPFFCQVEAAETLIWLNEVAPKTARGRQIIENIKNSNAEANPELFRLAAKMATGAGKTTVMAMMIAYHTINKSRKPRSSVFSNHFLIITPGITIKDRLRVLLPQDPDNYYEKRGIVPKDMLPDVKKGRIVITNYHAFKTRETLSLTKQEREILQGNEDQPIATKETEGQMLQRVCPELMRAKDLIVINDEAHHCYRHKPLISNEEEEKISTDEKQDVNRNDEAARLWINGIESLGKKVGSIRAVYDLSATPFFLRGSGYPEGRLFPWVVSDFSLMDAIECGIVKLPRIPVSDATATEGKLPINRNLYHHISKDLPKQNRATQLGMDPQELPSELLGALETLYEHYAICHESWKKEGIDIPPAFIIICNNTSTSKLVYDYVSGYRIDDRWKHGAFSLFDNIGEDSKPLARPRTLLIDSYQLDSGEALSDDFKKAMAGEIETFKQEMRIRHPDRDISKITDEDLLREVMNTVGKKDKLGEQIHCVVSVSMLSEGWDANNVTHIMGVRRFGTQLLCEQVVGRGLRRFNYDPEENGKLIPEYADVFGVPFDFAQGSDVPPPPPPKPQTRIRHLDERANLAITYPRIRGYKVKPPEEKLIANFDENSGLPITPQDAPPSTQQEGIIGEGAFMTLEQLQKRRMNEVVFYLAAYTAQKHFAGSGQVAPAIFRDLVPITRLWLRDYLTCKGGTFPQYLLWASIARNAAERIYRACVRTEGDGEEVLLPVVDPFSPEGSTFYVDFFSRNKSLWETREDKSHINIAVCDRGWEMIFCELLESDSGVFSYTRNIGLGFEVPYLHGNQEKSYLPDFIALIDDGNGKGDLLNLIIEIKGFRGRKDQAKADTMNRLWIPAVNNDGRWGRWAFVEITAIQEARAQLAEFTGNGQSTLNG